MYSESDLDGAIDAGILSPDAAAAFRAYIAAARQTPSADEESFRLLTGFNDIFVAIAIGLSLTAIGWIGGVGHNGLGAVLVAAAAWGLAEYFTRVRRMALPSIVLLIAFVSAIGASLISLFGDQFRDASTQVQGLFAAGTGLAMAGAAWLHWRRFMVPITVAAGALSVVAAALGLLLAALPGVRDAIYPLVLLSGIGLFALAMAWDISDRERRTRRSDVAFWLHLAAAPMIAHPLFHLLHIFGGEIGVAQAVAVLALYMVFGFVALAIDRRALLVSSLAYVLYALSALLRTAGFIDLGWAVTALVIGAALLMLSAFWQPIRRHVVGLLGGLATRLPPASLAA